MDKYTTIHYNKHERVKCRICSEKDRELSRVMLKSWTLDEYVKSVYIATWEIGGVVACICTRFGGEMLIMQISHVWTFLKILKNHFSKDTEEPNQQSLSRVDSWGNEGKTLTVTDKSEQDWWSSSWPCCTWLIILKPTNWFRLCILKLKWLMDRKICPACTVQ